MPINLNIAQVRELPPIPTSSSASNQHSLVSNDPNHTLAKLPKLEQKINSSPTINANPVAQLKPADPKASAISLDDAIGAMHLMDKDKAQGSFTLKDGRSYEIRSGEVHRQNKGNQLTRLKEGLVKLIQGAKASSSDANKLTQALAQGAGKSPQTDSFVKSWNTSQFTEPKSLSAEMGTRGHQSKADFQFIVHTAPLDHLIAGKGIFSASAESAMASWDVACTSIIDQSKTFTYGNIGVILKVPQQNILAASPDDLMSETNVGLLDRTEELVNSADKDKTKNTYAAMPSHQRTGMLKTEIAKHARHTNTPEQVLKNTYEMRNEILICTAQGVNIHDGEQATAKVEIAGIFLNDCEPSYNNLHLANFKGETLLTKDEKYAIFKAHAEPLAAQLGVPIMYLNGQADTAEAK